ncbi:MAG: hypothetical protein ACI8W8_003944 [Rhodothermales bacterium]|jgi:hypothetical protein
MNWRLKMGVCRLKIAILFGLFQFGVMAADPWLSLKGKDGIGKGQHIVFVTGEEFYRSEEGMPMFAKILSQRYGYDCTVLFAIDEDTGLINPNVTDRIPGLEVLANADLMVIFARFRELPDGDMKWIADFVNAGKPVVGIRNATHAFRYLKNKSSKYAGWDWHSKAWTGGFGQQVLGDTWVSHYGKFQKEATLAHANTAEQNHPVMRGVSDTIFCRTDVNGVNKLTPDDVVLLHGQVLSGPGPDDPPVTDKRKDTRMPLAWFKTYTSPSGKKGQSFCTTAGASVDWLDEDLRRVMVNAMFYLTGHKTEIPKRTNVDFVGDFAPTAFRSYTDDEWKTRSLRPESFGLK